MVASLNEAVAGAEDEPEEAELRTLGKKLSRVKADLLSLGRGLMLSQDPSLAAGAQKLIVDTEEAIRASQQKVRTALRRLGAASDVSEIGSVDLSGQHEVPARREVPGGRNTQPAATAIAGQPLTVSGPGNKVANLI